MKSDYLLLIALFLTGVFGIYAFKYNVISQIAISVSLGVLYVLWGVYHHHHRGDLYEKIIWEYISIAVLVVTALTIILLRT